MLCCGADWRQFRGNNADGLADGSGPKTLDRTAWTAPLSGRGISGPIIVGDRVFLTSSSGYNQDRLHVLAFSAADGAPVWERQFWATGRTQCHPKMAVATPTPASDGRHIAAFYSSNDLACLDLDGNLLWYRGLTYEHPNATNSLGMSSSPVIVAGTVIVQVESDDESFAMGIDVETGQTRWKLDRAHRATWTSPVILRGQKPDDDIVVLQSSVGLAGVRPDTGETVWTFDHGASTIPSSAVGPLSLFVPSNGLTALGLASTAAMPEIRWKKSQIAPATPSPVFSDGRVYSLTGAAVLVAADARSGDLAWRLRLNGTHYASPIASGSRLYFFNDAGLGQVVSIAPTKGTIASERDFKESILCTPALAGGGLYVRSDQHLWKIVD